MACSAVGSKKRTFFLEGLFITLFFTNHVSGEGMYLLVGNKTEYIIYTYTCEAFLVYCTQGKNTKKRAGLLSVLHSKRKYKSSWGASFCIQQGVFWPSHWCSDRCEQYCHHNFISFFLLHFWLKVWFIQLLMMLRGQKHSMSVQLLPKGRRLKNRRTAPMALTVG